MKTNITLIRMAGSGKSYLGKILAKKSGKNFIDLDEFIENCERKKLPEIIKDIGDEKFIELEGDYVFKLGKIENTIISSGGSIVYNSRAMKKLKEISKIIFLDVNPNILERRITAREKRGIAIIIGLKEKGFKRLYKERLKLYKKYADVEVVLNSENKKENIDTIFKSLSLN